MKNFVARRKMVYHMKNIDIQVQEETVSKILRI